MEKVNTSRQEGSSRIQSPTKNQSIFFLTFNNEKKPAKAKKELSDGNKTLISFISHSRKSSQKASGLEYTFLHVKEKENEANNQAED